MNKVLDLSERHSDQLKNYNKKLYLFKDYQKEKVKEKAVDFN